MTHREKKKEKKVKPPLPKQRPLQNLDDLFDEAKYGKLTSEEIFYVVEKIKASKPGNDSRLYSLLRILGWAKARQYQLLVESFLYYPTDAMVSSMAIKVLCEYWGNDARPYLNEIKAFIQGVPWDEDDFLCLAALQCTGDFLRKTPEKELFQILFDFYTFKYMGIFWQEIAFIQLARAVGKDWDDLVEKPGILKTSFSEKFTHEVVDKAKKIIKNLKFSPPLRKKHRN